MSNVADKIIEIFHNSGVKRVYGLIGDSLNPLGEAIRKQGKLDWITVRHEETAAFAAGAEALLSEKLCVCAATAGPGSVHLINGLYEANRNQAPLLAIVTDFASSQVGLDFFQATSPMNLYKDCSIFCEHLSTVEQMPRLLQAAMQTAISNHGVAVIIVPKDISEANCPDSPYERIVKPTPVQVIPNLEDIKKLSQIFNQHSKITLYCGVGCKDAKAEVLELAKFLQSPTVHTIISKYFMEDDNPYDAGLNGYLSTWESKYALDNCDLLVMLGCDFPFNAVIPTSQTTVQIDIAPSHLGRRTRLDFGIVGDVKSTLQLLNPLLQAKTDSSHLQKSLSFFHDNQQQKTQALSVMENTNILNPEYLTHVISQTADDDALFTIDVGLNDVWAGRYLKARKGRMITGSFKHGTMAAATPMAIGAHYAFPQRQIIALAGDGGLTMLLGDLLTIAQHNINIKIVVYNNGELGFINKEAMMEKYPPFNTKLKNPNFADLAEVIGIKGMRIEHPQNLAQVIKAALDYDGAVLIDAMTNPLSLG